MTAGSPWEKDKNTMIYIVTPGGTREKGGMGRIVDNFTTDLQTNAPDVAFTVIDTYGPGRFRRMPFYFAGAVLRLAAACLTGRAELLHVHMADYGSVLRKGIIVALAALFRVPVVLHLHAGRFPEQMERSGPLTRRAIARVIGACAEIVVLGDYWRRFTAATFPNARRITVLPNAVPGPAAIPDRVRADRGRPDGTPGRPVRLLFLGRLIPIKGLNILLDALATPACRDRDWVLTIAGDGDRDTYSTQAERLGLADRVSFTGWLNPDQCREQLAAADVLVQPSLFEGLPMAVLEAMAYGLTIVATRVGSVDEAVEDGGSGLLVEPGDAAALAAALERVLADGDLRAALAAAARQRFEDQYDIAAYRGRLLEVYRRNGLSPHPHPSRRPTAAPPLRRRPATIGEREP